MSRFIDDGENLVIDVTNLLKHEGGGHDQSSHGNRGGMSLDEAQKFLLNLDIDEKDEYVFWRKAFQAVAEKTGRDGKPTVKEFDGTEENVMFRLFEGGMSYAQDSQGNEKSVERKIDTFLNGDLPYASGGRYGFGLYAASTESNALRWVMADGPTRVLKLGSESKLKLTDMGATNEVSPVVPDLRESLTKKNPLWGSHTTWNNNGNITNLLLFAQGYDGLDMGNELVIWSNSKLVVDQASLSGVTKGVALAKPVTVKLPAGMKPVLPHKS